MTTPSPQPSPSGRGGEALIYDIQRKACLLKSLSIAASCMLEGSHPPNAKARESIALDLIDASAYLAAQVSEAADRLPYP